MSKTKEASSEQAGQLSPEEIAARKAAVMKFWENEIPYLKAQIQYETLVTELMELEARQAESHYKVGRIMAGPPPQEKPSEPKPEAASGLPRKLKTESANTNVA